MTLVHRQRGGDNHNARSLTYNSWRAMKERCLNPKHRYYEYYGGRGITVCERWLSFTNFYEDMGERPRFMSLDRKDCNKSYCKENCKWSTRKEQNQNRQWGRKQSDSTTLLSR